MKPKGFTTEKAKARSLENGMSLDKYSSLEVNHLAHGQSWSSAAQTTGCEAPILLPPFSNSPYMGPEMNTAVASPGAAMGEGSECG